jgi:hypothetical protein
MKQLVWPTMTVLVTLAVFAGGCEKPATENAAAQQEKPAANVKLPDAEPGIKLQASRAATKDTSVSFTLGAKLPTGWPADVPAYDGLRLSMMSASPEGFVAQGSVPVEPGAVAEFYRAEAAKHGWTARIIISQPQMSTMVFTNGERKLGVTVGGQPWNSSVSIVVSNK